MSNSPHNFENRLRDELKGIFAGPPEAIPAARDEAILAAARRAGNHYAWRRRVAWAMGAAAAIAVTAGMVWTYSGGGAYQRTGDIRDAYYVARHIKQHKALDGNWDATGDGIVDDKDVRSLALAAVKVQ